MKTRLQNSNEVGRCKSNFFRYKIYVNKTIVRSEASQYLKIVGMSVCYLIHGGGGRELLRLLIKIDDYITNFYNLFNMFVQQ